MTDPAAPVQTAMLTSLAMLAPHESLNLNRRRGLLAAEVGNGLTLPGSMAIYDVSQDCRHPSLQAEMPIKTGHESGFTKDGNTFWVAGGAGYIDAFDVSNPKQPYIVWTGAYFSHGLNLSDDGNTLYQTDPINGNVGILDVSEVQARTPNPQVREISRITWRPVSVPQNTIPLTIKGKSYLLEFDEFAFRFNPLTFDSHVGAARMIEISDPASPRVVSNLRLEVNQRENHSELVGDPGTLPNKAFGYSAHYCAVPRQVDPAIVACSFMLSGLRVFDIRRPAHPREVAYFVAPPKAGTVAGFADGNFAFSQPAFDRARRSVWYTDATSGFYSLRLSAAGWPHVTPSSCTRHRVVRLKLSRKLRTARVRVAGKRVRVIRRGKRLRVRVRTTTGRAKVRVRIRGRTKTGRRVHRTRMVRVRTRFTGSCPVRRPAAR
jgi:hypothetical protein